MYQIALQREHDIGLELGGDGRPTPKSPRASKVGWPNVVRARLVGTRAAHIVGEFVQNCMAFCIDGTVRYWWDWKPRDNKGAKRLVRSALVGAYYRTEFLEQELQGYDSPHRKHSKHTRRWAVQQEKSSTPYAAKQHVTIIVVVL